MKKPEESEYNLFPGYRGFLKRWFKSILYDE